ncbi:MAG: DUF1573 domain-containing protein [Planctomycetota bacterium]
MIVLSRVVLFVVLAAALPFSSIPSSYAQAPSGTPRSDVVVSPAEIELGPVGHLEQRVVTFELWNRGSETVPLTSVKASCDCMKVQLAREPLAPNERRTGRVEIGLGRGFGRFDKHIDIVTTAFAPPLVVAVRADFHPGTQVDVREFVLTGVAGRAIPESTQSATIERATAPALAVTDLRVVDGNKRTHPHLIVQLQPIDDTRAQFILNVLPEHPAGAIRGEVTAKVNGLSLVIPVRGTVFQGVRVDPEFFNFSRIDDVAGAEQRATLRSVDDRTLEIESIHVEPNANATENGIVVRSEKRADGAIELIARLKDPYPGPGSRLSGVVVVRTNHPDCPEVRLRYMGFVSQKRP